MTEGKPNSELIDQLKELVKKLDKPKKDISAWLGLSISFLSTVVIAGLSLYFSNQESERNYAYNLKQIDLQKANLKVEELKALNSLIPALSSKDTAVKNVAFRLLQAAHTAIPDKVADNHNTGNKNNTNGKVSVTAENNVGATTVIDEFYNLVSVAQSQSQPVAARKVALEKIGKIALSTKTPDSIRKKATIVTTGLAASSTAPAIIKQTASDILKNIKNVGVTDLQRIINTEKVTRPIDGIVVHSTGYPFSASKYTGLPNILNIANFQLKSINWSSVSWHYLIAPDGSIWLGAPLNTAAIHTINHNKTTVAIVLFMDGDKELPTAAQQSTFKQIVGMLSAKLNIADETVHSHQYFSPNKTCPGKLMTEDYIHQTLLSGK